MPLSSTALSKGLQEGKWDMVPRNETNRCTSADKTIVHMKANERETIGKPDAGNPPVRLCVQKNRTRSERKTSEGRISDFIARQQLKRKQMS